MTRAEKSWPPSHAPPPGATPCSMMATLTSGCLDSSYALLLKAPSVTPPAIQRVRGAAPTIYIAGPALLSRIAV